MSSTTSLKLPYELKARMAAMAAREGKTAHAYMVETLDESGPGGWNPDLYKKVAKS